MNKKLLHAFLAFTLGFLSGGAAQANPDGAQVAHGKVSFAKPSSGVLNVTNTPGAIINWQRFSIQNGETTRFLQNSATSAILNRVTGPNPSALLGRLLSNGRVFLINRHGIVFGPNAVIDTAGLVASTLNITDQDFISQNLKFQGDRQSGSIENQGYIKAGANGNIFLIAPNIKNSGIIETDGGKLVLAAGQSVTLASLDSDDIVFEVQAPDNDVVNLGSLLTHGGAASMFAGTIRHAGTINADSITVGKDGRVQLLASADIEMAGAAAITANGPRGGTVTIESSGDTVLDSGRIETKGSTGKGGHVEVLGERVALLDNATIDVSGDTGGGEALIGGDYQGNNPAVKNARQVYVGGTTRIRADALTSGDGGKVIVWSDDSTRVLGAITAGGGTEAGDGGLVETSGHRLDVSGARVSASAPNGAPGQWLLDPINVTIGSVDANGALAGGIWSPAASGSTIANTTIEAALAAGTSVTVTTTGVLAEAGNITLSAALSQTTASTTTLTLQADNDININAAIGTSGARFNHDMTLTAGNRIGVNSPVFLDGNNLAAMAPTIALDAGVDVGSGSVQLDSTGNVTQSAPITAALLKLLGSGGVHTLTDAGNQIDEVRMNTGSAVLNNNGTLTVNGILVPGAGPETVLNAPAPIANEFLGAAIDVESNVMVVGAPGTFMSGQGAAYVYRFDGTNWVFEQKLTVGGTINFGTAVAVEGNHIVVGAPETFNVSSRGGKAYPFEWNGSTWVQGSELSFVGAGFESNYGWSMDIDSDRLVVGGAGNPTGTNWAGRLWFYDFNSGTGVWDPTGTVPNPAPVFNDYFGIRLDISGDTMILGSANRSGLPGEARIYAFNTGTRLWDPQQQITLGVGGDFFGSDVSISGDVATVAKTPNGSAGEVYIYRNNGASFVQEQIITASDVAVGDQFGTAVTIRDGFIIAGSDRATVAGNTFAGAAYLFDFNGSNWQQSSKITAATPIASDLLGITATLSGQQIFLGAQFADPGGQASAGAAHVFDPADSGSTLASGLTVTATDDVLVATTVTATTGGIDLSSTGNITVIDDLLALASTINLQAGTDGSGDLVFDAEAAFNDPGSDSTINVFAGTTAGNTGNATLSGQNVRFLGASTDPGTSTIDLRLRGSGTLDINATGGDVQIQAGSGGPGGLDIINIVSGDLSVAPGGGGPMNVTATGIIFADSLAAGGDQLQALIQAANGKQTLNAGNGISLDPGLVANSSVNVTATGAVAAGLQQELRLNQDATALEGVLLLKAGGGTNNLVSIEAKGGNQLIDAQGVNSGIGLQTDGSTGTGVVRISAAGTQTLTTAGTNNIAVLSGDIPVEITAGGAQTINTGAGGINIQATSGQAATVSGLSQDIDGAFVQLISGALAGGSANLTATSGTQDITTTNGLDNSIFVFAGAGDTASVASPAGDQIINSNGGLRVLGGGGAGGIAQVQAQTGQAIGAAFIDVVSGTGNAIIDTNAGLQDIDTSGKNTPAGASVGVNEGILVDAAGSGVAAIHSDGTQDIAVLNSDLVRVVGTTGSADITSAGTQVLSVTGSGANAIEVGNIAGGTTAGLSLISGNQTLTAGTGTQLGSIKIRAGTTGLADSKIGSIATQTITTTGDLVLLAGSGNADDAIIEALNGQLDLDVGGLLSLTGGSGPNAESLFNVQSLNAVVGGNMLLSGGNGSNSDATLITAGDATIDVTGTLNLTGTVSNADIDFVIGGNFTLTTGSDMFMTGGSGSNSDADINVGGNSTVNIGGALNIVAGGSSADNDFDTNGQFILATAGDMNLIGGTGSSARADIDAGPLLDLTVGGNLTVQGGSGSSAQAQIDATTFDATVSGDMFLTGGTSTNTDADIVILGTTLINVGGALTLTGGTTSADVEITVAGDLTATTGTDLTLTGGTGSGAQAVFNVDDALILNIGGDLNLSGGSGFETDANIETNNGSLLANVTGAVNLLGSNGQDADVKLRGARGFNLNVGTNLTVTGGNGPGVFGFLGATSSDISSFSSPTTIVVGGNMILSGGSQSDADVDVQGHSIDLDVGGNLQLTGGSGMGTSVEIDNAQTINAIVDGILTLTGGSNTDTAALIGNRAAGVSVEIGTSAMPVGGAITLTGGSHVEGLAAIGTTCAIGPCPANVTINGGDDVGMISNAGEAFIGSLTQDPGSVTIRAGMFGTGFPALFGNGRVLNDGPVTLEALTGNARINHFGIIDAGLGTLTATSQGRLELDEISGGTLVLKSLSNDVDINTGASILQARAVGLDPATAVISIDAPQGQVDVDLVSTPPDGLTAVSGGLRINALNDIDLDAGDDDVSYNVPGDISITSLTGDVDATASAELRGRNVSISAGGGIVTGADINATGRVDINAGNNVNVDFINAAQNVSVNADSTLSLSGSLTTNGLIALNSSNGTVILNTDSGVLQSDKAGLAPGSFAIDIQALGPGGVFQNQTNFQTASGGIRIRADSEVDLHLNLGAKRTLNAAGDVFIEARNGPIHKTFGVGADISGRTVTLKALNLIDTQGDITATSGAVNLNTGSGTIKLTTTLNTPGALTIDAGAGNFDMTPPGQIIASGDISISGKDLFLNSTGITDMTSPTRVTLNATGRVDNFGATGGIPDVIAPVLNITSRNGVELDVDVDDLTINNTVMGDVIVIDTGTALNAKSVLNPGRSVSLEVEQGPLAIGAINGSLVTLMPGTSSGSRSITDSNGSARNITATDLSFSAANGFGTFANPIEIKVSNPFAVNTTNGDIGINQSGNLKLLGNTSTSGNVFLHSAGGQLLIQDQSLTSSAGTIKLSGNSIKILALGAPALVNANANLQVNATGSLFVEASDTSNSGNAKLLAGSNISINAGSVSVLGGDADFATASIDPANMSMTVSGNLNISGGAGNMSEAQLAADSLTLNVAGNTTLTGGNGDNAFAIIDASSGNLNLVSGVPLQPGVVTLTPGSGINADALLVANSGLGQVSVNAGNCINCTVLGLDPFLDLASQAGIFAGFTFSEIPPPVAITSLLPSSTDQVIVTGKNFFLALLLPAENEQQDEETGKRKRVLMCR